ncbi:hypothetical protein ACFU8R_14075 [Pseudonocardia alni]|uniref:hypothetical protein n=1 Tax=Pseudonocardia alni TaxID=33907 RepID=UPI00280BD420|nr:hypothetical protein [Pseudonocardia alni]
MSAAPATCTHPSVHVVAHLGSHEPLPFQPVPAPAGVEDLENADTLAARTGHLTLGRCGSCGIQVVTAQIRGGPDERRIEYPPMFAGRPDSADLPGFIDRGAPVWTSSWTAIAQPTDQNAPAQPDGAVPAAARDVDAAAARLRDVLTSRGIDLGPDAEQSALDAALAVLQPSSSLQP